MSTPHSLSLRSTRIALATTLVALLGIAGHVHAEIDHQATKQIWKLKYGVSDAQLANSVWLNEDSDGDGIRNSAEIAAGTNPFAASQAIKVNQLTRNGTTATVDLTFETEPGKLYRVEAAGPLEGPWVFQPPGAPVEAIGDGTEKMLSVAYGANRFFRVHVCDVDSDGDQLADWAERTVALNPATPQSVAGVNDYDYVLGQIAQPNVVSIKAAQPFASEDGPTAGMLAVTRQQTLFPVTVNYTSGGTAVAGQDYEALSGTVTLPAGASSVDIPVNPMDKPEVEGSRSVTATLSAPASSDESYTLGAPSSATVIINDSTAPSGTGLYARYYDTSSSTYDHAANFGDVGTYAYVRTGTGTPNTGTIVIPYNKTPAMQVGNVVKVTFTGGNLNNVLYNHKNYTVTSRTATNFTLAISGPSLPTNSNSSCNFSIQSFPHPGIVQRLDPVVNFDWIYGTPNDAGVTPNSPVDNYSTVFEGYLSPTTAGSYQFQLDADDKARVQLDLNRNGVFEPGEEILEHGWDGSNTPETVGTFKVSAAVSLAAPGTPAERYKIRVEHVETTGDARCRLQWRLGAATFANIPSTNVFSHTIAVTSYSVVSQVATVNATAHGLSVGSTATLHFSTGGLFTPPANYSGDYTVASVINPNSFTVNIPSAPNTSGAGFLANSASGTNGWLGRVYTNVNFSSPAGRVGVDASGPTNANNGLWGSGTPAPGVIAKDTFSARWTGQIQPQFTEEYTLLMNADDGVALWVNGQLQELKVAVSAIQSGSTYTYDRSSGDMTVTFTSLVVQPGSFVVGETVRLDPSSGNLTHAAGSTYSYDGGTGDAVIDYSNLTNVTPGSFVVGETIELDPTSGSVNLGQLPYQITAVTPTTLTVNFGAGVFATGTGSINLSDNREAVITEVSPTTFKVNLGAGKYPVSSTGSVSMQILNKTLKDWASTGSERFVRIPMVGGVRYNIQLDYWENTGSARCILSWFSPSQTRQIIPSERLYPSTGVFAPPTHITPTSATALVGGFFSLPVAGSNGATVTLSGQPAWLTYSNGVLSGTPPGGAAGDYQVTVTVTNAAGTSTSVVNLRVDGSGGSIEQEIWNNIGGTSVADIPTTTSPTVTATLTALETPTDYNDNYGARVRGYVTAPATGNYYFWIAGSDSAELWISNDEEPVNALKRAWVTAGSAMPRDWSMQPTQKSPWLALEQGKKYYIEILHKAAAGAGDNLAIGWAKPGQSGAAPSEVVPGYAIAPYVAPAPGSTPGTLYVATMLSQNGAATDGVGNSTLRLSEDENSLVVSFNYGGLSGVLTDWHLHNDPYLAHGSSIMYDPNQPPADSGPQGDGSHKWTIPATVGTMTKADVVELLKQGKAYINLHTALYPAGEIRGNFTLANGSRTFSPPPPPPSVNDDHTTNEGASRFLTQATYGPNPADIAALKAMPSYDAWIEDQFAKEVSHTLPEVIRTEFANAQGGAFDETLVFNAWWRNSVSGPDQLRQRLAFALSEILVVSAQGPLDNRADALAFYYDMLADHAFGNFRDLLEATTLAYTMGRYLDMYRNDKPDLAIGRSPNENYAREIKQLFSIGLFRMWPDGTLMMNSKDELIPTYTQREIVGFAHVFTGWDYGYDGAFRTGFGAPANFQRNMREVPARHFTGPKRILNNEVLPGLPTLGNQPLDPYATHSSIQYNDPAYQRLPAQDLIAAHDQLFNHPNTGPFICRQLIQRLVTSHPSRDYLHRVVQKFNNDGAGVRGNLKAVIKAILLDYEARSPDMYKDNAGTGNKAKPIYGKQREAVMRVTAAARAFRPNPWTGTYSQTGTRTITIDTAAPHRLVSGNSVFLDFTSGSPAPFIGAYSVTVSNATRFTVQAPSWAASTTSAGYRIPANSTTCTITMSNHWLQVGHQVYVDFTSGAANSVAGLDGQVYTLTAASAETGTNGTFAFSIDPSKVSASERTGNAMVPRFTPGSYVVSTSGLPAPNDKRITLDTNNDHHLAVGDRVQLNFTTGNPLPTDMVATVDSIVDLNTYTVLAPSAGTNLGTNQSNNGVYQFPLVSQPLTRSGNVSSRPSTFNMGRTDADIDQSPLNSPTVFNFFLPDYKFPGTLASQGITTPEFQETAETSVIRQANFLERGIYASGNTNGLSSFKSGSNALVMDLGPWMVNPSATLSPGLELGITGANTGKPWTSDENLSVLIDRLNTLLLAGQLPAGVKTEIMTFVQARANMGAPYNQTTNPYTNIPYNNSGTPSDTDKRNRMRAILHFVLTSPDFTIQR